MSRKGFTLIELLVVVAVLALLASIVFSNLSGAREGARISNALSFQSQTHSLLGSDLVGWWNFNDPDARYKDLSGEGYNGGCTSCPTPTDSVPGTLGNAMNFSGSNFIDLPIQMNNTNFGRENAQYTFSSWMKLNQHNAEGQSVIFGMAYYNGFGIMTASDGSTYTNVRTYFRNSVGQYMTNSVSLNPDEWYYVVSVLDKRSLQIRLFINGDLIHQRSITSDSFTYENYPFRINGMNQPGGNGPWARLNAVFDDVRIYSRALTAQEIQTLYAQTTPIFTEKGF